MLETGRLNKQEALDEMSPDDLQNFWRLYQIDPFGARSLERRLARVASVISGQQTWDIFPGFNNEYVPVSKPVIVTAEMMIAHWDRACDAWEKAVL